MSQQEPITSNFFNPQIWKFLTPKSRQRSCRASGVAGVHEHARLPACLRKNIINRNISIHEHYLIQM